MAAIQDESDLTSSSPSTGKKEILSEEKQAAAAKKKEEELREQMKKQVAEILKKMDSLGFRSYEIGRGEEKS